MIEKKFVRNAPSIADAVDIIYFPDTLSTKLRVDEFVYSVKDFTGELYKDKDAAHRRLARERLDRTQIRFAIRVDQEEIKKLREYLESGKSPFLQLSCTHVACSILKENTGVRIPAPFNLGPTLNAAYLAINRLVPGGRVQSIELVSKDAEVFSSLKSSINKLKPGLKVEGILVLVVSAGATAAGGVIRYVIPLFVSDDEQLANEEENR